MTEKPEQRAGAEPAPDLSIIIPAYNDAGSIESVVREAAYVAGEAAPRHEILVINDGSDDSTGEILDKLVHEFKGLRVIHHPVNHGFGRTLHELYEKAAGNLVFSIPGDGQIRASQLERMLPAAELADLVVGKREIRNDPGRRKSQSYVYNFLVRLLYRVKIGDVNSSKLIHRRVLDAVLPLETMSPFIDAELCIKTLRHGMTIRGVVIEHMQRQHGSGSGGKLHIILATIRDLFLMWPRLRPQGKPLEISAGAGKRTPEERSTEEARAGVRRRDGAP